MADGRPNASDQADEALRRGTERVGRNHLRQVERRGFALPDLRRHAAEPRERGAGERRDDGDERSERLQTGDDGARGGEQRDGDGRRQQSADELRGLGEEYLQRARHFRLTDKPFFTDKMPVNWIYAGVIPLILPNARIVDVRRHPLDCCFANWKQLYGKGLEHTYSMAHMGRYYADYVRLMRLVDGVQPGKAHRVIYERMVEDTEGEVRRLLDYLGLPFDEACLNFHSNERSVRTISAEQVRRPINREGLDRWKPYEQWLGPMKEALGTALEEWDR